MPKFMGLGLLSTYVGLLVGSPFDADAEAGRKVASSGHEPVQLIELYSSESCSSCPPADLWISSLRDKQNLWKTFVPIKFHVDYWNDLGWKDELASSSMTQRQREIAETWQAPSVYTPGVVVDGLEWRNWRSANLPKSSGGKRPSITIYEIGTDEFRVTVEGLDRSPPDSYGVRFAKLGMGIVSNVTSGENSGRKLNHDFVVLEWHAKPVQSGGKSVDIRLSGSTKKAGRYAVVAWLEKNNKPLPLQAAGGYL